MILYFTSIKKVPLQYWSKSHDPCDTCFNTNKKCLSFPDSMTKTSKCLDLIHMDIQVAIFTPSLLGHKYFIIVINDFSRYCCIFLMKNESETSTLIKYFVTFIQTQLNTTIKTIIFDNGPTFHLQTYYSSQGIHHQASCVSTPQ